MGIRRSQARFKRFLKIKKVNIETAENPKMASIEDYWDNQTLERITELLHEYNELCQQHS